MKQKQSGGRDDSSSRSISGRQCCCRRIGFGITGEHWPTKLLSILQISAEKDVHSVKRNSEEVNKTRTKFAAVILTAANFCSLSLFQIYISIQCDRRVVQIVDNSRCELKDASPRRRLLIQLRRGCRRQFECSCSCELERNFRCISHSVFKKIFPQKCAVLRDIMRPMGEGQADNAGWTEKKILLLCRFYGV